jgi:hypothetical protein
MWSHFLFPMRAGVLIFSSSHVHSYTHTVYSSYVQVRTYCIARQITYILKGKFPQMLLYSIFNKEYVNNFCKINLKFMYVNLK